MSSLDLSLAGERFRLTSRQPPWDLGRGAHRAFLLDPGTCPDVSLQLHTRPRLSPAGTGAHLHTVEGSWTLYLSETGHQLDIFHPRHRTLQATAALDPAFARGAVTVTDGCLGPAWARRRWTLAALLHPTLHLVALNRLAASGKGLMLHALGVRWKGDGLLFVGRSGAGKSTLARLFLKAGAEILCDECVAVRREARCWQLHGTPFRGEVDVVSPGPAPLAAVFLIQQAAQHQLEALAPGDVSRLLLPQAFLPFWNASALDASLQAAERLLTEVPCYRLGFARSPDVVSFVESRRDSCHAATG